jgi:hypothetical protein
LETDEQVLEREQVSASNSINDIYKKEGNAPRIQELSVILSPYSNRGERIGARISVYKEKERER